MTAQPTLFDGAAVRSSDPASSRLAAARCNAGSQRMVIAAWLLRHDRVSADQLAAADPAGSHRSVWSSRLGGLVADGLLAKAGLVDGPSQPVCAYRLTAAGRQWATDLTGVA